MRGFIPYHFLESNILSQDNAGSFFHHPSFIHYRHNRESGKGFTLIEIIITIAIFTVLITLGLLMSMETFRGTLYRSEEATIVSLLERARSRAMNNINQSTWSVCYVAPTYVISKGSVCGAATMTDSVVVNDAVALASDFVTTFPTVVFTQLSGTTTPATITVKQDNRASVITINNEGTLLW